MEFLCKKKLNYILLISREDGTNEEKSAEKRYKCHSQECLNFHSICLNFQLLAYESIDLSQDEKKITIVKDEQIHKMRIIFTQNGQKLSF